MPRFFFNVHDGREIIDEVGLLLRNLSEARHEAILAVADMLRDYGMEFWTGSHWQMYVTDEAGKTVIRLNFSAESRESNPTVEAPVPDDTLV